MATSKTIETRGHVTGFREEIAHAADCSRDAFFTWFDTSEDADAAFIQGQWDFAIHISAALAPYVDDPQKKTVLEIGHGGGRLLSAASRYFHRAIGVDIHDRNQLVIEELRRRGCDNVELCQTDGKSIPFPERSIDVVYSYIVLQHVEKMDVFRMYLAETYRLLNRGGIAILYFGRRRTLSVGRKARFLYWIDRVAESGLFSSPYQERAAKVNDTNLRVSLRYAKRLARGQGFQVLDTLVSHKRLKGNGRGYGGQHGLILRRAEA